MKHGLEVLAAARPPELDPDLPIPPDVRHKELATALRNAPRAVRRARRRRWATVLATATAMALAAAGVVVFLTSVRGDGSRTDGIQPRTPVPLSARQVLLTAADTAAARRDAAGQYFHFVVTRRIYQPVMSPAGRYVVVDVVREEGWFGPDDRVDQIQDLGTHPAGPRDEATWRAAGSPRRFLFRGGLWQSMSPGPVDTRRIGPDDPFFGGPIKNLAELAALPTDPQALQEILLKRRPAASAADTAAEYLFDAGATMSLEAPLKPQVRAALLRMMAGLPGIASLGRATDSQGRAGTAVAMTVRTGATETSRIRLIIDPATGMPLGQDLTVVSTVDGPTRLRAGQISAATTLVSAGWTSTHP
jgi:hypothetical protein